MRDKAYEKFKMRMAAIAKIREHVEDTYGGEPFKVNHACASFLDAEGITPGDWKFWELHKGATKLMREMMSEPSNGYDRYIWIGGAWFQLTSAVPPEVCERMRRLERSHVDARLRREAMWSELEAMKRGVDVSRYRTEMDTHVQDLLASI